MPYKDPEKRRQYNKRHYEKNREQRNANRRKWHAENAEHACAKARLYRKEHPEIIRQYLEDNSEKVKEACRLWREKNPEYGRLWKKANPEKVHEEWHRRRSRKFNGTVEPIRKEFYKECLIKNNNQCVYCFCPIFKGENLHWDHDVPLVRGGAHSENNLVPSCAPCNLSKHTKTGAEFREYLKKLKEAA